MFEWLQLGRLAQSGLYSQGECKPLRMMAQINNKQGHSTSLGHVRNTKKAKSSLICPPPYPYKSFLARHCNTLDSRRLLFSKVWGGGGPQHASLTGNTTTGRKSELQLYFLQPGSNSFVSIPVLLKVSRSLFLELINVHMEQVHLNGSPHKR